MEKFSNESLLIAYAAQVPVEIGKTSPVIFVDADETPGIGYWALCVQFEKTSKEQLHPLRGKVVTEEIVVHRAMCNVSKDLLTELPAPGEAFPEQVGLHRDFQFVGAEESYPEDKQALSSGFQPFLSSSGKGAFNSEGKLLILREFVGLKSTAGKIGSFPEERLTSVGMSANTTLSKRERLFAAYRAAFGAGIQTVANVF